MGPDRAPQRLPRAPDMNHDPMCPYEKWQDDCQCDLIARVREDERGKRDADGPWFRSVVHECCVRVQDERAAALRDAVEAVKAALPIDIDPGVPGFDPTERKAYQIGARYGVAKAVAAIEALGGER